MIWQTQSNKFHIYFLVISNMICHCKKNEFKAISTCTKNSIKLSGMANKKINMYEENIVLLQLQLYFYCSWILPHSSCLDLLSIIKQFCICWYVAIAFMYWTVHIHLSMIIFVFLFLKVLFFSLIYIVFARIECKSIFFQVKSIYSSIWFLLHLNVKRST